MKSKDNMSLAILVYRIRECIDSIYSETNNINENLFYQSRTVQNSVHMMIQVIGESVSKIIKDHGYIIEEFSDFPWKRVYGFRNIISHDYFSLNAKQTWNTIKDGIPLLSTTLDKICLSYPDINNIINEIYNSRVRENIHIIKNNPKAIAQIPFHEQNSELVNIAIEECKNFPGINPSDLAEFIKPELRDMALECKGYWGVEFPSNDLVWRDD